MNMKKIFIPILAIAAAIAGVVIANRKTERAVGLEPAGQPAITPALTISESTLPTKTPAVETKPQIHPTPTNVQPIVKPGNISAQTAPPANANGLLQDPTARIALSFVGADPVAEAYWVGAINDPNVSADERQNLIEDLNEDGLSDPKHPGPEDLPLILNRIRLIEQLAPNAMDQVNADAFAEAYKDLGNMLAGKPV